MSDKLRPKAPLKAAPTHGSNAESVKKSIERFMDDERRRRDEITSTQDVDKHLVQLHELSDTARRKLNELGIRTASTADNVVVGSVIPRQGMLADALIPSRIETANALPDLVMEVDRLTERLRRAEQFFVRQKLKADVSVPIGAGNAIAFVRKQNTWRLVWRATVTAWTGDPKTGRVDPLPTTTTTETDLVDCSIERKAEAADALAALLTAMYDEAKRRLEAAQHGNAAMDAFEKLVGISGENKEGN